MAKSILTQALAASAALSLSAIASAAVQAEPVYMIAQIEIEDEQKFFNDYGSAAGPTVLGAGGRVLVATPTVTTLEGEWNGNWTVVIEFPSEEAALEGWYNTEAYAMARDIRIDATTSNTMILAPQLPGSLQ